jgi:hypothetical protein
MKSKFTIIAIAAILSFPTLVSANDLYVRPVPFAENKNFRFAMKNFSTEFSKMETKKTAKVCACQIMSMQSNNYKVENAIVLSEKTMGTDEADDMKKANDVIENEKKLMKDGFYDKIEIKTKATAKTDCQSLLQKMKAENAKLKIYELLDADARN